MTRKFLRPADERSAGAANLLRQGLRRRARRAGRYDGSPASHRRRSRRCRDRHPHRRRSLRCEPARSRRRARAARAGRGPTTSPRNATLGSDPVVATSEARVLAPGRRAGRRRPRSRPRAAPGVAEPRTASRRSRRASSGRGARSGSRRRPGSRRASRSASARPARRPPPATRTRNETMPPNPSIWRAAIVVAGVVGKPRVEDAARRPGAARGTRPRAAAFAQCARIRTASVFRPRSDEPGVERPGHRAERVLEEPEPLGHRRRRTWRRRRRPGRSGRPGTWWSSARRCRRRARAAAGGTGEAKVLSTTTIAPAACAASAAAAGRRRSGAGWSASRARASRSLVEPVAEACVALLGRDVGRSGSPSARTPWRRAGTCRRRRRSPQTTWAAGSSRCMTVVVAAIPDANAIPCWALSSDARHSRAPRGSGSPCASSRSGQLADRLLGVGRRLVDRHRRPRRCADPGPGRRGSRGSRTPPRRSLARRVQGELAGEPGERPFQRLVAGGRAAPRLGVPGEQAQHAGLAVGVDVGAADDRGRRRRSGRT